MNALAVIADDLTLPFEVARLAAELEAAEAELRAIVEECGEHEARIRRVFAAELERFNALEAEVRAELEAKQPARREPPRQPPPSAAVKRNRKPPGELRALYKRIAQKCHPDKTQDQALNEFFTEAAAALAAGDLARMRDCHGAMLAGRPIGRAISTGLRAKRNALRAACEQTAAHLAAVLASERVALLRAYQAVVEDVGQDEADARTLNGIRDVTRQLERQLSCLKAPPVPPRYVRFAAMNGSATTTTTYATATAA